MKENSIEENIKILEKNVESVKENSDGAFFETDEDYYFFKAVDHILSDYKRVLKENEELKDKYATFVKMSSEVITNSIPVQKIKDKIEEVEQEKKKYGNCLITIYENELVNRDIQVLQELLESEE